jgi:TrmH family RNA methyltransferase
MTPPADIARFRAAENADDLAVLDGLHAIKHALRFGATVLEVLSPDVERVLRLARALAPDVLPALEGRMALVDRVTFRSLAPSFPATDVIAIARRPAVDLPGLLSARGANPVVLLDRPHQLNNIGAAIRVAAAAGADAVATTGDADPWHRAAIRAAAGLHFALPVGRVEPGLAITRTLVAVEPGSPPPSAVRVPADAVLAFGSERDGLAETIAERATVRVGLPMREGVSSLNLATAVAAVLYALPGRATHK